MDLNALRSRIDGLDNKIVQLLNERANTALSIGVAKRQSRRYPFKLPSVLDQQSVRRRHKQ